MTDAATLTLLSGLTIFSTSFIIALSGALMPGPLLTVTLGESPRRGWLTGPVLVAGHGILELALVASLLMGLAPILQKKSVFVGSALAGSIVLFWMALGMFRERPSIRLGEAGNPHGGKAFSSRAFFSAWPTRTGPSGG